MSALREGPGAAWWPHANYFSGKGKTMRRDRQVIVEIAGGNRAWTPWLLVVGSVGFAGLIGWSLWVLARSVA